MSHDSFQYRGGRRKPRHMPGATIFHGESCMILRLTFNEYAEGGRVMAHGDVEIDMAVSEEEWRQGGHVQEAAGDHQADFQLASILAGLRGNRFEARKVFEMVKAQLLSDFQLLLPLIELAHPPIGEELLDE